MGQEPFKAPFVMMKYYLTLKDDIEQFISEHYDFEVKKLMRQKASPKFRYRRKLDDRWSEADDFGRNERDYIAENPRFRDYTSSIKMYLPYRVFNKMVADLVMQKEMVLV